MLLNIVDLGFSRSLKPSDQNMLTNLSCLSGRWISASRDPLPNAGLERWYPR